MTVFSSELLDLQAALAGEFSIERELGRGGMGVVYLARDVQLDRNVAIKVLPSHLADTPLSRERFLREARTAAGLSHPNIVPVHRVGEAGERVYFVMSFVPGESLGERLRRAGPMPAAEVMRIMREVAWALAYAHRHGVVHRDVKPDNILLEEGSGRAMVTDFGIAHIGAATLDSAPGRVIGTAQFMSPEQALNETVDGRSDLYALGIVGYLALSGQLPFEASSVPALLLKQVSEAARDITSLAPGLPRPLSVAIDRCLAKDPERRFQTGEALADALVPPGSDRGALPAPLRAWVAERNPATTVYAIWSGLVAIPLFYDASQYLLHQNPHHLLGMIQMLVIGAAPLVPMAGFHANRAQRLFRAGFSLADLRGALDVADRERDAGVLETDVRRDREGRQLRWGAGVSFATAMTVTFLSDAIRLPLELRHVVVPLYAWQAASLGAWLSTVAFLFAANMTQTRLMPEWLARLLRGGLRERLWRSRVGEAIARRLGAPDNARHPPAGVFQPTEAVLGLAAADLFAALPQAYRVQLAQLPATVAALEAAAARARAEVEVLAESPSAGAGQDALLAQRHGAAAARLTSTVAALEGIRLDLLRLHAGTSDLEPLTTLIEAAQRIGADVTRMAAAQLAVEALLPGRVGVQRVATPA